MGIVLKLLLTVRGPAVTKPLVTGLIGLMDNGPESQVYPGFCYEFSGR